MPVGSRRIPKHAKRGGKRGGGHRTAENRGRVCADRHHGTCLATVARHFDDTRRDPARDRSTPGRDRGARGPSRRVAGGELAAGGLLPDLLRRRGDDHRHPRKPDELPLQRRRVAAGERRIPLRFLRVYGTVFLGARALTTDDLNFFMLVAVVHFSVGAAAGAVFHVFVNRFVPGRYGAADPARRRVRRSHVVREFLSRHRVAAAAAGRRGVRAAAHAGVGRRAHARGLRPDARHPAAARALRRLSAGGDRSARLVAAARRPRRAGARRGAVAARGTRARRSTRATASAATAEGRRRGPAADDADRQAARLHQGHVQVPLDAERHLPTDEDLYRVISRGVYRTSMPDWALLSRARALGGDRSTSRASTRSGRRAAPGTPIFVPQGRPPTLRPPSRSLAAASSTDARVQPPATATVGPRRRSVRRRPWRPTPGATRSSPFDFTKGRLKSGADAARTSIAPS